MRVEMVSGGVYDIPSTEEMRHEIHAMSRDMQALLREEFRGVKPISLVRYGFTGVLQIPGPRSGYVWSVLSATAVSIPVVGADSCELYMTSNYQGLGNADPSLIAIDNINNQMKVYSKGSVLVESGTDLLLVQNQAAIFNVKIQVLEVPAEQIGKLYL